MMAVQHSPVCTAFVEKIQVFNQQAEERNHYFLSVVYSASRPPHGCFQRGPVTREVARRIHLVLQNREFSGLDLVPLETHILI